MARFEAKLRIFKAFAEQIASLSTCKRASVGCIIFDPGFKRVLAIGYNGPPAGLPNDGCTDEPGHCGCIHAEANALMKLESHWEGCFMISTTSPCRNCTGLIINSGRISRVYYCQDYRDSSPLLTLEDADIDVRFLK